MIEHRVSNEQTLADEAELRVLVVEDDDNDAQLVLRQLRRAGHRVAATIATDRASLREQLASSSFDVVISDFRMHGFGGADALAEVRRHDSSLPFIVVSGTIEVGTAIELLRSGAADYLFKDDLDRLGEVVRREVADAEVRRAHGETLALDAALDSIHETLHSSLDEDELVRRVGIEAAEALDADASVMLMRTETDWVFGFVSDLPPGLIGRTVDPGALPVAERVLNEGRALLSEGPSELGRAIGLDARAVLHVPLIQRGHASGVLSFLQLGSDSPSFGPRQVAFAERLGSALSLALENARLYADARQHAQEMDAVFDAMGEAVLVYDKDGTVVRTNQAVTELLGADPLGMSKEEMFRQFPPRVPDDGRLLEHHLPSALALAGKTIARMPMEISLGPRRVTVLVSASPLLGDDGRVVGAVAVWTDVSDESRRASLNEALNDISLTLQSTMERAEIARWVIDRAVIALGCDSAALLQRRQGTWGLAYATSGAPRFRGPLSPSAHPFVQEALATRSVIAIPDCDEIGRGGSEGCDCHGVKAELVVPMSVRGEAVGLLMLNYHAGPHDFTVPELDFARRLGASLSLALENTRLYESVQRELARSSMLQEVASAVAASTSIAGMSQRVAEVAGKALDARLATVHHVDPNDNVLRLLGSYATSGNPYAGLGHDPLAVVERAIAERDTITHEDSDSPENTDSETGSGRWAALPLKARHTVLGVLSLVFDDTRAFTSDELSLYRAIAEQLSVALERARLYEIEHRIADTLQQALLSVPDRIPGLEIAHLYQAATEEALVGGDFYDVFELSHDTVALIVGDVSGKGLEAASLTALVKNAMRAHAIEGHSPAVVMAKTNDMVTRFTSVEVFVTAFFGVLDRRTGELLYCIAGHPPPIIMRGNSVAVALEGINPVAGAFLRVPYSNGRAQLEPHDALLLYTDGIVEARREGKMFGEERLLQLARRLSGLEPSEIAQRIYEDVRQHAGGRLQDDLALMAVRLKPRRRNGTHPMQQRLMFDR